MNLKQKIGSKIIFGIYYPFFFRLTKVFKYLTRVINNQTFNANINGENWLRNHLLSRKVFLDVGFNQGEFSKYISEHNKTASIYAFDPNIDAYQMFKRESKKYKNIELEKIALSDCDGESLYFDYGELNGCNSLTKRKVDFPYQDMENSYVVITKRLDDWFKNKGISYIDFMKLDAEGFDLNILEGSVELLIKQKIGIILFEYATGWLCNKRLLKDAIDFIEDKPYSIFKLYYGFLVPFKYQTEYEGSFFSMFVLISDNEIESFRKRKLIKYPKLFEL